jgi:pyruvate dehydrogenase E2 component (dihydrolipoamide acetyltransferase)
MRVRGELKAAGEEEDASKITVKRLHPARYRSRRLREPKVNASFDGDAIVQYGDVNLGVAIALDEGLVTPRDSCRPKQIAS